MSNAKLRQAIALEAARLMYDRVESEYFTAKRKAAKRLCRGPIKPADLPSNAEIRDLVQSFARVRKGSDIDIHVFCDGVELLTGLLENEGYRFDVERKQVVKHGEGRIFTHI